MALSGTVVRSALAAASAVGKQIRSFDELAAGAAAALRQAPAGLTPKGAAAFLATVAVESAWFRTTTEYGTGQRYAPYIGRTFIQLTWEANYAGFGRWCRARDLVFDEDVFVKTPAALSDFRWAWLGAVYYFEVQQLWGWANGGDFLAVSQAVNGGRGRVGTPFVPNGQPARQAMYEVFLAAGKDLLPAASPTREPIGDDTVFIENIELKGGGDRRRILPVGAAVSAICDRAWISMVCCGPGGASVQVFAQDDTKGKAEHTLIAEFSDGHSTRQSWEIPPGTTQLNLRYSAPDGAVVCLEAKPR